MRVVVATHNAHKVAELQRILGAAVPELELVAYDGPAPEEDGDTFAANALIKARAAAEHTGTAGASPTTRASRSMRSAGRRASTRPTTRVTRDDAANVRHLLEQLAARGEGADRAAQFTCAAALVDPGEIVDGAPFETVELGVWPGSVAAEAAGGGGFGYDPVFVPEGLEVTAAEISAEEKNATSHRARAFAALAAVLRARAEG